MFYVLPTVVAYVFFTVPNPVMCDGAAQTQDPQNFEFFLSQLHLSRLACVMRAVSSMSSFSAAIIFLLELSPLRNASKPTQQRPGCVVGLVLCPD